MYRNVSVVADGSLSGEHDRYGSWVRFSAHPKLLHIHEALRAYPDLHGPIWDVQDGYGVAGCTPPQGWDWSGIRDSSEEALDAMYAIVLEHLSDEDFSEMLGVKV